MLFSTEARLSILRPLFDSWCRTNSKSGLGSWFWVSVVCMQNEANFNYQFHNLSRNMWLYANDFKHRQIIYRWKAFFVTSMNSGSLPQKRLCLARIHLQSFIFAQKCMPTIQTLSLGTEGTIFNRRLRRTCWDPEPLSNSPEDGVSLE